MRHYYSLFTDVLWREPLFFFKYYKWSGTNHFSGLVFMADGRMAHGGLLDRFKGIVSVYALSKVMKVPFRIHWDSPFPLEKYFYPNRYDWKLKPGELSYSIKHSKPIIAYGEHLHPDRFFSLSNSRQYHIYYGFDSLDYINQRYHTSFTWTDLFQELFVVSPFLQKRVEDYKHLFGYEYIAIHLRFQNLLGDIVEKVGNNKVLSSQQRDSLIKRCYHIISFLKEQTHFQNAFIASDSNYFLTEISTDKSLFTTAGNSVHIDNFTNISDADVEKNFLDLLLIAEAQCVYSVKSIDMYNSAFPKYAAKIKGIRFKRIEI